MLHRHCFSRRRWRRTSPPPPPPPPCHWCFWLAAWFMPPSLKKKKIDDRKPRRDFAGARCAAIKHDSHCNVRVLHLYDANIKKGNDGRMWQSHSFCGFHSEWSEINGTPVWKWVPRRFFLLFLFFSSARWWIGGKSSARRTYRSSKPGGDHRD